MSSGAFTFTKYETDAGKILKCRVQPETLAFAVGSTTNSAPTADVDTAGSARMSGSRRALGVRARAVYVSFDDSPPSGYKVGVVYPVPALRPAVYQAAASATTGTYLSTPCRIVGLRAESVR